MYGPKASHVSDVFHLFNFKSLWQGVPFVDYILGAEPGGGVFAIGYCDNEYQQAMLSYYKMGDGPFYLFYRPYHLCHVEAMPWIIEALVNGRALLQPTCGFRTNVYAYAKRDLRKGDRLDGIGGFTCYGLIENCFGDEGNPGLPICLAEDVALKSDVLRDEKICMDDIVYDPGRMDYVLYAKARECSCQRQTCG
jgi:predicted homoserine dehydrogenase-like protein